MRTFWDMAKRDEKKREVQSTGLEGASEGQAGIIRDEEVERGEEVSIGGSPPSAAGGTRGSPAPTREDLRDDPAE